MTLVSISAEGLAGTPEVIRPLLLAWTKSRAGQTNFSFRDPHEQAGQS
jgi:hypothetical protein